MDSPRDSQTVTYDQSDRSANPGFKQHIDETASKVAPSQDLASLSDSRASRDPQDFQDSDLSQDDNAESEDMPPGGKLRPGTPKRDADFSSFLMIAEKIELNILVTKITDGMAKQISQAFEKTSAGIANQPSRPSQWSDLPSRLKDLSFGPEGWQGKGLAKSDNKVNAAKENAKPSRLRLANGAPLSITTNSSIPNRPALSMVVPAKDEPKDKDDSECHSPVLREELLDHLRYKKWQIAVCRRVSDISVKKTTDSPNSANSFVGTAGSGKSRQRGTRIVTEIDPTLAKMYPAIPTTLNALPWEKKCLLLHAMLLLLLSLDNYCAYSRVLLLNLTSSLALPLRILAEDEVRVAKALADFAKSIPVDDIAQKMLEEAKSAKKSKLISFGMSGGSAGLAAPLVAAGIGSVPGGMSIGNSAACGILGPMADNVVSTGRLFGLGGTKATPKMMDQYVKDVQDFAFKPTHGSVGEDEIEIGKVSSEHRRLRVVFGINGWLTSEEELLTPWNALGDQAEIYGVRWELDTLKKMRNGLATVVKSLAWSLAKKEIVDRAARFSSFKATLNRNSYAPPRQLTALSMLKTNQWPYDLLRASKNLENPWNVGMVRADKVGSILADMIMNKVQGERGVTLIGFSLGARVIYSCLHCLSERRAVGLVENAILMGTPGSSDPFSWCAFRSIVSGRLVNVFSESDFLLGFLSRQCHYNYQIAGLQRIEDVTGVENVDVSDKVSCHMRYQYLVGSVLRHIGWEDIDWAHVDKTEEDMLAMELDVRAKERKRDAVELGIVIKEEEVPKASSHDAVQTRVRKTKGRKTGGR